MARVKTLKEKSLRDLKDHMENTSMELIKCYSISQLALMDWKDTQSIKRSWKYLPVRIDTKQNAYEYRQRNRKRPYQIKRIRVDEIKFIYAKRNKGKKLYEEY